MSEATLLEVHRLSVDFQLGSRVVRALSEVSIDIGKGEILGLVGESGCGKSLTSLAVMRLLPPNAIIAGGRVRLGSVDMASASEQTMRKLCGDAVAMIFQEPMVALNPLITIGRQIEESLLIHRSAGRAERRERALELLSVVGIPAPAQRYRQYLCR